jgi:hypothetical protein
MVLRGALAIAGDDDHMGIIAAALGVSCSMAMRILVCIATDG